MFPGRWWPMVNVSDFITWLGIFLSRGCQTEVVVKSQVTTVSYVSSVCCSYSCVLLKHKISHRQYVDELVEACFQNLERTCGSPLGCPCSISPVEQAGILLSPTPMCVSVSVVLEVVVNVILPPWLCLSKIIYCHIEIAGLLCLGILFCYIVSGAYWICLLSGRNFRFV